MKVTRIAIAIVALALLPSFGMLGGDTAGAGALRPRAAAAGPMASVRIASAVEHSAARGTAAAPLDGRAKRDLGLAMYLSSDGLAALVAREPRTLEDRVKDWLVPTSATATSR